MSGERTVEVDLSSKGMWRDRVSNLSPRNRRLSDRETNGLIEEVERERAVILTIPDPPGDDEGDSGIAELASEDHMLLDSEDPSVTRRREEPLLHIFIQVFIPFMIAGLGMMAAGLLLDEVQVCLCHCMSLFCLTSMYLCIPQLSVLKSLVSN